MKIETGNLFAACCQLLVVEIAVGCKLVHPQAVGHYCRVLKVVVELDRSFVGRNLEVEAGWSCFGCRIGCCIGFDRCIDFGHNFGFDYNFDCMPFLLQGIVSSFKDFPMFE